MIWSFNSSKFKVFLFLTIITFQTEFLRIIISKANSFRRWLIFNKECIIRTRNFQYFKFISAFSSTIINIFNSTIILFHKCIFRISPFKSIKIDKIISSVKFESFYVSESIIIICIISIRNIITITITIISISIIIISIWIWRLWIWAYWTFIYLSICMTDDWIFWINIFRN